MYKHIEQASYQCYSRSGLSPLPPELVALNYGCDANHDISLAIVTRPSFKELKRERRDIGHGS
ncbi:hypothetical protein SLEP1_g58165 [Rubroshorea leprosula]|uniref:Uncharacterized protein n=1 Tax=Rubroshorea leprosula TaxID=152421 RepID=A0AAV5MNP4_9ROSI|nr:hypothetical protein SLEP1_g58165 [Rubroshorea leprosula]